MVSVPYSRRTPDGGAAAIAAQRTSMTCGLGKVTRHARATRRVGSGEAKFLMQSRSDPEGHDFAAETGTTEIPAPLATMCLTVSSELPSKAPSIPPGSDSFGQACTT